MPPRPAPDDAVTRAEFEDFVLTLLHELRNRLNALSLEATDLAERTGTEATRLQRQVRECAAYLRTVRELAAPDDPATRQAVAALVQKLHDERTA